MELWKLPQEDLWCVGLALTWTNTTKAWRRVLTVLTAAPPGLTPVLHCIPGPGHALECSGGQSEGPRCGRSLLQRWPGEAFRRPARDWTRQLWSSLLCESVLTCRCLCKTHTHTPLRHHQRLVTHQCRRPSKVQSRCVYGKLLFPSALKISCSRCEHTWASCTQQYAASREFGGREQCWYRGWWWWINCKVLETCVC